MVMNDPAAALPLTSASAAPAPIKFRLSALCIFAISRNEWIGTLPTPDHLWSARGKPFAGDSRFIRIAFATRYGAPD
jgi:hypothetical protein